MATTRTPKRLLRRKAAAVHLLEERGLPETGQSLARKAVDGTGPKFQKYGRHPLYSVEDLDAYADACLSPPVRSYSEFRQLQRHVFKNDTQRTGTVVASEKTEGITAQSLDIAASTPGHNKSNAEHE